jgi:hypothetical protein
MKGWFHRSLVSCRLAGRGARWIGLVGGLLLGASAKGHDLFTDFVQHDLELTVGQKHLDLTVTLTFFERPSESERLLMDGDRDGRIRRREVEEYLAGLSQRLTGLVRLRLGDERLGLVPLYAPELDLLGDERVGWTHHQLKLFYFCAVPPDLGPKDGLVVEDAVWPDWPALVRIRAVGQGEYEVRAEPPADPLCAPLESDRTRVLNVSIQGRSVLASGEGLASSCVTTPPSP